MTFYFKTKLHLPIPTLPLVLSSDAPLTLGSSSSNLKLEAASIASLLLFCKPKSQNSKHPHRLAPLVFPTKPIARSATA